MADKSAFKKLYSTMINNGGDVGAVMKEFNDGKGVVKKIKCFVKESFPYFLVTDNYFYIPCYFTKKAVDEFKSKHSGVNITDLKSKIIEIGDWTLEMAKVNSADVFTSYGGIEIKLIAKSFKLAASKEQVLLSRYPLNLYRDDEMKTLFQAYTHGCLTGAVAGGLKGDSLPDVSKKGDSVVSFASGSNFSAWKFKAGSTQTQDMSSVFKAEKGASAFKKLTDAGASGSAKVGVLGKVPKKAKPSAKKAPGVNIASKLIKKTPQNPKKSVGNLKSGKTPGTMKTPTGSGSAAQTPKATKENFQKMMRMIKDRKKNK